MHLLARILAFDWPRATPADIGILVLLSAGRAADRNARGNRQALDRLRTAGRSPLTVEQLRMFLQADFREAGRDCPWSAPKVRREENCFPDAA